MAHYIQYSNEHLHIIDEDGTETCYLSRNWTRCTAGTGHSVKDASGETAFNATGYYDGEEWRFWTDDERELFAHRVKGEDDLDYLQLADGTLL